MSGVHQNHPQIKLRLPPPLKDWISLEAKRNLRSQNAEIVLMLEMMKEMRLQRRSETPATGAYLGGNTPEAGLSHTVQENCMTR